MGLEDVPNLELLFNSNVSKFLLSLRCLLFVENGLAVLLLGFNVERFHFCMALP